MKPESNLDESPTWPYVLAFAKRMEAKLAKNRHKGDRDAWMKDDGSALFARLEEEVDELQESLRLCRNSIRIGNVVAFERQGIINEAADVANFAMMIADKFGGCEP